MFKRGYFFILILCLSSLCLGNCGHRSTVHGHYIKMTDLEKLKVGESSKADVKRILGTPSAADPFKDENWFYIGQTNRKKILQKPEILDRQIVAFSFNEKDILTEIMELSLEDSKEIEFVSKKTETAGQSPSFVQQFIGNFGRFRKQQEQRTTEKKK